MIIVLWNVRRQLASHTSVFLGRWIHDDNKWTIRSYQAIYLSIYLSIYLWLYSPLLDLGRFFSFLTLYTVGRTPRMGDQPVARPLPTHRTTKTSMPLVGFEPTISAFEIGETVDALHRAALLEARQVKCGMALKHKYFCIWCMNQCFCDNDCKYAKDANHRSYFR
jgi:hypothetical protein